MKKNMQNGRSMIEMLGVLAIIGVLTVGGYGLINKAQTSRSITLTIDQLTSLAQKVRYYARDCDEDCKGDITSKINEEGIFPEGLTYDDGKFSNRDDVVYTVEYLGEDNENGDLAPALYVVTLENLNEEACIQLATINLGGAGSNGFVGRVIGDGKSPVQYTLTSAVNNCDGGNKKIRFGFR